MQGTIYTGYAVTTKAHGYVTVALDFFSHGLCYWPCSNQKSPSMAFELENAEKQVKWLNDNFEGIEAEVKPLRYCEGEWIDHP